MNFPTLITQDRLDELSRYISLAPEGLCAELGVYKGGSLAFMAHKHPDRQFWGFDTFTGLPAQDHNPEEPHNPGDFNDTSLQAVKQLTDQFPNITLIEGYFPSSMPLGSEDVKFSFVHIDCDFYEGVRNAIMHFWPMLKPGGIMIFDDWGWPNCPGVAQAVMEAMQIIRHVIAEPTRAQYQYAFIKP